MLVIVRYLSLEQMSKVRLNIRIQVVLIPVGNGHIGKFEDSILTKKNVDFYLGQARRVY